MKTGLYNMEVSWGLTKQDKSRIEAAQMRFLRKWVGVCGMDDIKCEKIREQLGTAMRCKRYTFIRFSGERMWTIVALPPRKMLDCKPRKRP